MQPALEKILGQPVVVENRAGAGGTLGVDAVAKAAPDGYTIGLAGAGALGVNIGERTKRMYDPAKDLAPISRAAESPFILVATPALNANTLGDVIKLAKAEPNRMSIGHGGNGTAMQLAAMMFVTMADVKINLVPYRGTAPAVTDAIAGHVQLAIADPPPSMGAISEGKLKAIAVSSKQRFSVFPDVPTFHRAGPEGFRADRMVRHRGAGGDTARRSWPGSTPRWLRRSRIPRSRAASAIVGMEPTPTTPAGTFRLSRRRHRQGGEGCACGGRQTELSGRKRGCRFDCCDGHYLCLFLA